MDEIVRRAMAKWPNAPAISGWLRLDRLGRWLLEGEPISREAVTAFIGRNYECDDHGRWFFQNGPQRCFVDLDYTPWVFSADGAGWLVNQLGEPVYRINSAWVDETGSLLLETERGAGLLRDADGAWAVDRLRGADGERLDEDALLGRLEQIQAGGSAELYLSVKDGAVKVGYINSAAVPSRFLFIPNPAV